MSEVSRIDSNSDSCHFKALERTLLQSCCGVEIKMNNSTEVTNTTAASIEKDVLFNLYYYGLFFTLTLINIPGNILVVTTILRHRQLRHPANYFLVSLAFSDLLMGFLYPVYNVSHLEEIPAVSGALGKFNIFSKHFSLNFKKLTLRFQTKHRLG